jgi:hypothetical protein
MRKLFTIVLGSFFFAATAQAQCTVLATATENPLTLNDVQSFTPMSVTFNPNFNLYYVTSGGNPSEVAYTYDASGNLLATTTENLDYRGAWWNPNTGQMECNTYNGQGIYAQNIDGSGYLLTTYITIFATNSQPYYQSMGCYDATNNLIVYYNGGTIYTYDRNTGLAVGTMAVTGLPATSVIDYACFYTGCPGKAYGLYDYVNRAFYFINETNGAYVTSSQLPPTAPTMNFYGASYTNGMLWLCDNSQIFHSYYVIQPCSTPANITPAGATTFCQGSNVVLNANTGVGLTYQWLQNGTNITGATTSSYTATTSGSYAVAVTNGCTSTSTEVVVTVNPTPAAVITPQGPTTICSGDSVVMKANADTTYTYQWLKNGIGLTGATDSAYTATISGTYKVVETNTLSCSDTSAGITVVVNPTPAPVITQLLSTLSVTNGPFTSYQWYRNNTLMSGATSSTYTNPQAGSYYVIVTNAFGCSDTSNVIVKSGLGVNNIGTSATADIYPNPTSGIFTLNIESGSIMRSISVRITNVTGREVTLKTFEDVNKTAFTQGFDLTGQPTGIYLAELTVDGQRTVYKLIVR